MGRAKPFIWGAMLMGVWLVASSDVAPNPYAGWTPYFMERSELEKSVFRTQSKEMLSPGKIWTDDENGLIFVVERYKGVHIIDNSDPSNPSPAGFIVAPGCMDVAVKGDVIYLDNAVDLVAFDMAANNGLGQETERLENWFTEPVSPVGERYNNRSSNMILVGWKQAKKAEGRE
ncbi:MAG: hypothetical protein LBR57_00125 [Alistipes sp.]|jgi:hypothetical protein|nr:hypothetical protein [Alistipes sp.]